MHREIIRTANELAGHALDALAAGDTFNARKLLKAIQHGTSDARISVLENFAAFQQANGDLPRVEAIIAEAEGVVIEGTYRRGGVS